MPPSSPACYAFHYKCADPHILVIKQGMGFSLEEGLVVVVLVTEIDGPTHAHTQMGKQYSGMMAMYCDDSDGGRPAPAETLHHSFHR